MKFTSVYSAVVFAAVLGGAFVYGFEGRVPIYKSSEDNAPVQGNEATNNGVGPMETHARIAAIDPELLWGNWNDPGSIPTSKNGTLKAPTLIEKNSPRKRGAVLLEYDAIVVWNGLEDDRGRELLIFGSHEKSIETMNRGESDVALGIVPLSGKPSSIQRTGSEFEMLKGLFELKYSYKHPQGEETTERYDYPDRAPYCAFDLEIKDSESFAADVNSELALRLPGSETSFSPENLAVVDAYLKRDVRHFLFDVFDFTERDESSFTKTSLAVEFPTPRLFVPAEIGKIGVSDRVMFNLLVFTPGKIKSAPGNWFEPHSDRPFLITIFPKIKEDGPMFFSIEEFKKYAPTVAKFCEENGFDQLVGRKIVGSARADEIDGDFESVVSSDSEDKPREEATPQSETKLTETERVATEKPTTEKKTVPKSETKESETKKSARNESGAEKENSKASSDVSNITRSK